MSPGTSVRIDRKALAKFPTFTFDRYGNMALEIFMGVPNVIFNAVQ